MAAGCLSDAVGLADGATLIGVVLIALAVAGGVIVTVNRGRVPEGRAS
ncbi:hypothetical protein LCE31_00495 [Streptomyces sp. 8L]|nr:hypothetical protein [Streptomyces sp. 8L]MCA1216923.1 hypothetical protein [Streptomyces sp. 8L]